MALKITGGTPLNGSIEIIANKNAVLPVLCATLLTKGMCTLKNVPKSPDVLKILEAIDGLGGFHEWKDSQKILRVCCDGIESKPVSDCVSDIQSAILFVGPLLARFGVANVPIAIGCKLGYRGPEDHIAYLSKFGAVCKMENNRVIFSLDRSTLQNHALVQISPETTTKRFLFSEASVTPTENLLMLLTCVTKFNVEVQGIAQEPHVEFLIQVLRSMGVIIEGKGSCLIIKGRLGDLKKIECDFADEPDYVDFYGTAITIALSKGLATLKLKLTPSIMHMIEFLRESGVHLTIEQEGVIIDGRASSFLPVQGFSKANERVWKLNPKPWPGFPVDCLPSFIAWSCANQNSETSTTVLNWMYEDGIGYVHQLAQLREGVVMYPTDLGEQKLVVHGTNKGKSFTAEGEVVLEGVPVIEGTRALVSAALASNSVTIIKNVAPLLRRAPDFVSKYGSLGAKIEVV